MTREHFLAWIDRLVGHHLDGRKPVRSRHLIPVQAEPLF